jgi:hypothetical protein
VRSLSSPNVVSLSTANRSNTGTSRKDNERSRWRTAVAISSSGTPARSKLRTQRALRTSPGENVSLGPGFRIPISTNRSTYSRSTPALRATSRRERSSTAGGDGIRSRHSFTSAARQVPEHRLHSPLLRSGTRAEALRRDRVGSPFRLRHPRDRREEFLLVERPHRAVHRRADRRRPQHILE